MGIVKQKIHSSAKRLLKISEKIASRVFRVFSDRSHVLWLDEQFGYCWMAKCDTMSRRYVYQNDIQRCGSRTLLRMKNTFYPGQVSSTKNLIFLMQHLYITMSYTNFAKEISKFCRGHKCKAVQRVTTKVHLVFLFFALSSKSGNNVAFFY